MSATEPGMSQFAGKVMLVTGAGRGAGRSIAIAFASQGATIAVNDITPVNLDETIAQIAANGGTARDYVFDVAKKIPLQTMVEQVVEDWGRIDFLINAASVRPQAAILDMDEWDWTRTLEVNLTGTFLCIQLVGRVMREQGGGVIVNVGPLQGGAKEAGHHAAYLASKSALVELTRQAASELAPYRTRIHLLCEGYPGLPQRWEETWGDLGDLPRDLAGWAVYLCSPATSHLTGLVIDVSDPGRPFR